MRTTTIRNIHGLELNLLDQERLLLSNLEEVSHPATPAGQYVHKTTTSHAVVLESRMFSLGLNCMKSSFLSV